MFHVKYNGNCNMNKIMVNSKLTVQTNHQELFEGLWHYWHLVLAKLLFLSYKCQAGT